MYCKICGKYIDNGKDICYDCLAKLNNQSHVTAQPAEQKGSRKAGLAVSIWSAALAVVAIYLAMFAIEVVALCLSGTLSGMAGGVFLFLMAVGASVVALIFGIKSINVFKAACRNNEVKPIATLVVGINGVVGAASGMFMCFITFIMMFAALLAV